MNPNDLMKQVARMKTDMERVQNELKDRYVEASSGNGAVEVTFNGGQELVKISLDEDKVVKNDQGQVDLEFLEDLIIAAVNQGLEKAKELANEEMNDATGGLAGGIPGLF